MTTDTTQLLTPRAAAQYLECPISTIRAATGNGDLKYATKKKGLYYYKEKHLDTWFSKAYPNGCCTYGSEHYKAGKARCAKPQAQHDPWGLHMCEEHTKKAHYILEHPDPYAHRTWPDWTGKDTEE